MNILAIDTSCDETAAAVTSDTKVISNIIWSSASMHAQFGGVMPSLAQRQHEERIDFVVHRALGKKHKNLKDIDAIAVTIGPGLSIALGVGINKARELAVKYNKPLIPVNHIEAHLLSSFANSNTETPNSKQLLNSNIKFPALGLILSGGTTVLCLAKGIGTYEVLAETSDDALGEALDKAARLLGFGYPGGAILEKFARSKSSVQARFKLPLPLQNDVVKNRFSYSGLKTAFVRLFESVKEPTKQDLYNLAATFQDIAFEHILRVLEYQLRNQKSIFTNHLLLGGGVANNILLRSKLRKFLSKHEHILHVPYTNKLNGDNAAMIGVCAYLKNKELTKDDLMSKYTNYESVDRNPRLKL
jgi:N6-L-threonylcarbamoyladenine synthase